MLDVFELHAAPGGTAPSAAVSVRVSADAGAEQVNVGLAAAALLNEPEPLGADHA
jgi:hypothetical protein